MFEGMFSEKEIKGKLSELKEIDRDMYEYILNEKIKFNKFKVLKRTFEQTVKRYLTRIAGFQNVPLKEYLTKFIEEYQKRLTIKDLINRINNPSHKKKILYVTSSPTFNMVRQSIYLRKNGYETILLMERNLSLTSFYEKYFDVVFVFSSIYTLYYILKKAKPYLVHVQGTTRNANHFGILAKFFSKSKTVFNFYDIPSTTITEDEIATAGSLVGGEKVIGLDFFSERFACEKCDGLIFGYSTEVRERLKSRYSINIPMLEFHSYPCDEFISEGCDKYSDKDGKVHLVYGGNVAPSRLPEQYFGDCQFHSLIDKITRQGIHFDIFVMDASLRRIKRAYGDYLLMSEENPLFRFKRGKPLDEVTKEFSRYDFGMMVYDFYKGTFHKGTRIMEEHIPMRLADKFFTYLEAGLPILISEELRYGAMIVKEYEMGIVVSQKDLDNLSGIIKSYDREKLKANVKRAREELSMKRQIGRLIDFYEQVVGNK